MEELIREPLKENIKNNLELYIMCCIPVFPFYLSADFFVYLYLGDGWKTGNGLGNCLLLITSVLLLVCFAVFRYALKGYIRNKAEKYSLLLVLGITSRDFWKLLAKEYCPAFLFLLIIVALGSNAISNLILMSVFKTISCRVICSSVIIMAILIMLFLGVMAGTIIVLKWNQRSTSLAYYLESLSNGNEKLHKYRMAYRVKVYVAFLCFVFSFALLYEYSVGKMFVAVLLHLAGIYFLLQINGRLIKGVVRRNEKKYYQKLLIWTDFIFEYRLNGNAICSIYAVNLLVALMFGGFLASDFPLDSTYIGVEIMLIVMGISIVLEGQAIILERMILDIKNEKKQHNILFHLGIGAREYRNLLQNRIKNMFILPGGIASVMGIIFFLCDYVYQENVTTLSRLKSLGVMKYIGVILIFGGLQYCGYLFARKRVVKEGN